MARPTIAANDAAAPGLIATPAATAADSPAATATTAAAASVFHSSHDSSTTIAASNDEAAATAAGGSDYDCDDDDDDCDAPRFGSGRSDVAGARTTQPRGGRGGTNRHTAASATLGIVSAPTSSAKHAKATFHGRGDSTLRPSRWQQRRRPRASSSAHTGGALANGNRTTPRTRKSGPCSTRCPHNNDSTTTRSVRPCRFWHRQDGEQQHRWSYTFRGP